MKGLSNTNRKRENGESGRTVNLSHWRGISIKILRLPLELAYEKEMIGFRKWRA